MAARNAVRDVGACHGPALPGRGQGGQADPHGAENDAPPRAGSLARPEKALRKRREDPRADRHRHRRRGHAPACLHPCGRRRHHAGTGHRVCAAVHQRRLAGDPVQYDRDRAPGPAQDGLSGPAHPDRHPRHRGRRPAPYPGLCRCQDRLRRPGHLRHADQRRDRGRVPAGIHRHAPGAHRPAPQKFGGHHRPDLALPPGADGFHPHLPAQPQGAGQDQLQDPPAGPTSWT